MKKVVNQDNNLATFLTIISTFLLVLGIITGTHITQKSVDFYTLSYEKSISSLHPQSGGCPATSNQTYSSLRVQSTYRGISPVSQSPEINLALRGYEEVNEKPELINYGGDTDPIMPPSIGTMFTRLPTIVKTYKVHKWDWVNNRRSNELESNWPVNLIGLATNQGESLVGPRAGREIGEGNVLMLLFATQTSATFTHSNGANIDDGYLIHIDNFCIDPILLSTYQTDDASGRGTLPVIRTGQVFGYGNGSDVRIAIRDTADWMDPRSKKDWWQGIDNLPTAPPNIPTSVPTRPYPSFSPTPIGNSPTPIGNSPTPINNTPTLPTPTTIYPLSPTPNLTTTPGIQTTTTPSRPPTIYIFPTLTVTPQPTATLTPTPTKTLMQIIVENPVYGLFQTFAHQVTLFFKVVLP